MGRGCAAFGPALWTQHYGLLYICKRAGFGGLPFGAILWSRRALPPLQAHPQAVPSILSWVRAHLGQGRAQKALSDVKGFVPLGWCWLQGCSVHEQSLRTNAAGEIRGSQVRHGAGGAALAPPLRLQGCLRTELCQLAVEPTAASPPRWETTAEGSGIRTWCPQVPLGAGTWVHVEHPPCPHHDTKGMPSTGVQRGAKTPFQHKQLWVLGARRSWPYKPDGNIAKHRLPKPSPCQQGGEQQPGSVLLKGKGAFCTKWSIFGLIAPQS